MISLSKVGDKPNFLFGQLPHYFKENDSYKPNAVLGYEGDGFVERYLEGFCKELDNELTPYMDNIGYLYDALGLSNIPGSNQDRFLIHIAEFLGNPPDISTKERYKLLLTCLKYILQTKGSWESINLYLALFGYKVDSYELIPYDSPLYDKTPTPDKYDVGYATDTTKLFYFDLNLVITDYPGYTYGDPGVDWLALLKEAISNFLLPVNVNLLSITFN